MNKLLVIVGPTATGKTSLALHLSKVFGGKVVSADSRQIYRDMDIGTGKDLPAGQKVLGYDLVNPKEKFSVSDYVKFAEPVIKNISREGKLPILVGGTGLYVKAVVDGIVTVEVPKNESLRKSLVTKTPDELFEMLAEMEPVKAASLNQSDKKNPRRLVRAIEVARYKLDKLLPIHRYIGSEYDVLVIGLTTERDILNERIEKRVDARVSAGMENEIKKLLANGITWDDQSMTSLGYRQWRDFFDGKRSREEVINEWKKEEKKYAKRQMTWFKKDGRINWFKITEPECQEKVEKMVKKWYK